MPVRGSPRTGGDAGPASGAGGATPSAQGLSAGGATQGFAHGAVVGVDAAASVSSFPSSPAPAPLTDMPTPSSAALLGAPAGLDLIATSPGTPSRASSPLTPPTTMSSPIAGAAGTGKKGKGRAVERRVLPARIRRAAGRSEGIRELEEMVVDWLERYADINTTPPESLQITLATLPLALITPRPVVAGEPESVLAAPPEVPAPETRPAQIQPEAGPSRPRIETPSFVFVKQGADDEEEAREELASARARMPRSPTKRLRHGVVGTDHGEDTSDAYYEQQHRKFEVFERRQRIREREKLSFERYKMRARVDLLRSLPDHQWAGVVASVLSRSEPTGWERGRAKLAAEGVDWLRRRLIREGKDLLARYDQLLPSTTTTTAAPDAKKYVEAEPRADDRPRVSVGAESSRPSTPSAPSVASSASPPPRPAPRSRDEAPPSSSSRRGRGRGSLRRQPSTRSTPPPPTRKRTRSQHIHGTTDDEHLEDDIHDHTDPAHDSDSSSALSDPPSPPPEPAKKITLKLNLPRARARESASASSSPAPRPPDATARVRAAPTRSSPRTAVTPAVPPQPQTRSSPRTTVTPVVPPQPGVRSSPRATVTPAVPLAVPSLPQTPAPAPVHQATTAPPRVHKPVLVQTKLSFAVAARPAQPAQPAVPAVAPHAQLQPATQPPALERVEAQPPEPPVERVEAQPPVPPVRPLPARTLGSPPKALRPQRLQARPPSPRVVVTPQPGGSILLEAARKRELGLLETTKGSPVSNGTPDRRGARGMQSRPFGMPLPASVERSSEFMLSDDEFLPIMAERKRAAESAARRSLSHTESTGTSAGSGNAAPATTDEDVLDMEGVEEAVVL